MPIVTPISAANKLRNQVLAVPGTVLIGQAGHPDKVIRFEHVPEYLTDCRKKIGNEVVGEGDNKKVVPKYEKYIYVNLDNGPDQEAWNTAMREVFSTARRDRPVPNPIPVAPDSHEEWSVSLEDVPLIENGVNPVDVPQKESASPIISCDTCTMPFNSEHALKIHKGRAHKK